MQYYYTSTLIDMPRTLVRTRDNLPASESGVAGGESKKSVGTLEMTVPVSDCSCLYAAKLEYFHQTY